MEKLVEKEFVVLDAHSAAAVGSGGLNVFGTPSMIAFMENVALTASEPECESGDTTVGIELNVRHLAPTAIGRKVRVQAELVERHKKILTFKLRAFDDNKLIGEADHKRAIVNIDKFMQNV